MHEKNTQYVRRVIFFRVRFSKKEKASEEERRIKLLKIHLIKKKSTMFSVSPIFLQTGREAYSEDISEMLRRKAAEGK